MYLESLQNQSPHHNSLANLPCILYRKQINPFNYSKDKLVQALIFLPSPM